MSTVTASSPQPVFRCDCSSDWHVGDADAFCANVKDGYTYICPDCKQHIREEAHER